MDSVLLEVLPRTAVGSSYFASLMVDWFVGPFVHILLLVRSVERSSCAFLTKKDKQPGIHQNVFRTLYKYLISEGTNTLEFSAVVAHCLRGLAQRQHRVTLSSTSASGYKIMDYHPFSLRAYSLEHLCISPTKPSYAIGLAKRC